METFMIDYLSFCVLRSRWDVRPVGDGNVDSSIDPAMENFPESRWDVRPVGD